MTFFGFVAACTLIWIVWAPKEVADWVATFQEQLKRKRG